MIRQQAILWRHQGGQRRDHIPLLRLAGMALASGPLLCLVLLHFGLAAPPGTSQVAKPVQEYIGQLESSYRDVKTLKAEFTQTYIADGRTRVESCTTSSGR